MITIIICLQICILLLFVTISVVKTEPIPRPKMSLASLDHDCNGCHCCNGSCAGYCNSCAGNLHTNCLKIIGKVGYIYY